MNSSAISVITFRRRRGQRIEPSKPLRKSTGLAAMEIRAEQWLWRGSMSRSHDPAGNAKMQIHCVYCGLIFCRSIMSFFSWRSPLPG